MYVLCMYTIAHEYISAYFVRFAQTVYGFYQNMQINDELVINSKIRPN